jgi:hypothetical protein
MTNKSWCSELKIVTKNWSNVRFCIYRKGISTIKNIKLTMFGTVYTNHQTYEVWHRVHKSSNLQCLAPCTQISNLRYLTPCTQIIKLTKFGTVYTNHQTYDVWHRVHKPSNLRCLAPCTQIIKITKFGTVYTNHQTY